MTPYSPMVSIIVPTKNSGRFLERCLQSIRLQDYKNLEIIVADNFSDDDTVRIASTYADLVLECGPERSAQLNAAARAAKGEFIYRVDSDFELRPGVVSAALKLVQSGADAVAIPNDSDASVGFWARVRQFERQMYRGDSVIVGARFFSRQAFSAIGGFEESMIVGEDYDIHNRLLDAGFKIVHSAIGEVHLGEPRTLFEIARKSYYYGTTGAQFLKKSGARGISQLNPFRAAYLRNWRHFARHPLLALPFLVMQVVKYSSGAFGMARALWSQSHSRLA